jgi:hypothetical protein
MHSEVSSDWLPGYIKAMQPVLKVFKVAGYFLDSPRMSHSVKCALVERTMKISLCELRTSFQHCVAEVDEWECGGIV